MEMASFDVLSQHSSGGTEEEKKEPQDSWHLSQAAYQALPEYESFVTTGANLRGTSQYHLLLISLIATSLFEFFIWTLFLQKSDLTHGGVRRTH
jgi:hypothetical protein